MELNQSNKALIEAHNRGYRIDKNGNIFNPNNIELKKILNEKNYYCFTIKINEITNTIKIHRLQAYQKFGNKLFEENILVRHKNNIKTDNSWNNILIGTAKENNLDIPLKQRTLNSLNSTKKTRKYSNEFILQIRKEYKELKLTQKDLREKYNLSKSTLHHLLNHQYLFEKIEDITNGEIKENDLNVIQLKNEKKNYSSDFINELKLKSINKTNQELSDEFNISKGMISYLLNK